MGIAENMYGKSINKYTVCPSFSCHFFSFIIQKNLYNIMSFCAWTKGEIYKDHFETGHYVCSKCEHQLFGSESKYSHQTPWPAFKNPIHENSLSKRLEEKGAFKVSCGKCGNGLGHEFVGDGPGGKGSRF